MMQLTVQDAGSLAVLTLQGELGQRHVDELKACLRRSLECASRLIVSCEKITGVDVACLQAICLAHRSFALLQKSLTVAGARPGVFSNAVRTSGQARCVRCPLDHGQDCRWR